MEQTSSQLADLPLLTDWMSELPRYLQSVPLNCLAIPGSHNSFSSYLDKDGDLGPDVSRLIRDLAKVFGPTVKDIVQRWSTTQTLSITKQLQSGIRYFDFRIAKKPKCDDVFLLHGLYGHKVETELAAIRSFLKDHPREVVLIDCNHFYCMTEFDHKQCLSMFLEVLGDIMCPVLDMDSVNLETMWQESAAGTCLLPL
ncbi:hypothetical protein NP493_605g01020 [Ridgeia piscesae]|uniref:PI-PLC X domain-containing protein 3 n=1 Tax=Ridgeia piscesae TaxID=27915 RepID=A0AAD9KU35_RIDPI|nr:hypothetical protein NP493_605g01020 [Ridgeia piscesae]